jgi:hypothetical protein
MMQAFERPGEKTVLDDRQVVITIPRAKRRRTRRDGDMDQDRERSEIR